MIITFIFYSFSINKTYSSGLEYILNILEGNRTVNFFVPKNTEWDPGYFYYEKHPICSCTNKNTYIIDESGYNTVSSVRAEMESRDFDWERLRYIDFEINLNQTIKILAPWIPGSTMNR